MPMKTTMPMSMPVLLAYFQEPAACLPIIRAFCIPEEQADILWSDMVTETLPVLLVQTCNGRLDAIKELILDKEAPGYVRGAAVEALSHAVALDLAEREEIIAFLAGLLTGTEAATDSYFWGNVVCTISDLHPREAMGAIRQAFAAGLVPPNYVGVEEIERDLARDREEVLAELRARVERRVPQDVHDYLSWFACFHESPPLPSSPASLVDTAQQKKKRANRVKGKLAKKARKKNRR